MVQRSQCWYRTQHSSREVDVNGESKKKREREKKGENPSIYSKRLVPYANNPIVIVSIVSVAIVSGSIVSLHGIYCLHCEVVLKKALYCDIPLLNFASAVCGAYCCEHSLPC